MAPSLCSYIWSLHLSNVATSDDQIFEQDHYPLFYSFVADIHLKNYRVEDRNIIFFAELTANRH